MSISFLQWDFWDYWDFPSLIIRLRFQFLPCRSCRSCRFLSIIRMRLLRFWDFAWSLLGPIHSACIFLCLSLYLFALYVSCARYICCIRLSIYAYPLSLGTVSSALFKNLHWQFWQYWQYWQHLPCTFCTICTFIYLLWPFWPFWPFQKSSCDFETLIGRFYFSIFHF